LVQVSRSVRRLSLAIFIGANSAADDFHVTSPWTVALPSEDWTAALCLKRPSAQTPGAHCNAESGFNYASPRFSSKSCVCCHACSPSIYTHTPSIYTSHMQTFKRARATLATSVSHHQPSATGYNTDARVSHSRISSSGCVSHSSGPL